MTLSNPKDFESAMSCLTVGIATMEKLDLTPEQQSRYEQLCVRVMSLQARMMRQRPEI